MTTGHLMAGTVPRNRRPPRSGLTAPSSVAAAVAGRGGPAEPSAVDVVDQRGSAEPSLPIAARRADALLALVAGHQPTHPPTVVVHLRADARRRNGHAACRVDRGGPAIPSTVAERLACGAALQALVVDRRGNPLHLGRRRRTVSPAQLCALRVRDENRCVFPGCPQSRHLLAHHVRWWRHGGPTDLDNLALVCAFHHRLIHDHGYRLRRDRHRGFTAARPDGVSIPAVGAPTRGHPAALRHPGIDDRTITPRWGGERLDLGYVLAWLLPELPPRSRRRSPSDCVAPRLTSQVRPDLDCMADEGYLLDNRVVEASGRFDALSRCSTRSRSGTSTPSAGRGLALLGGRRRGPVGPTRFAERVGPTGSVVATDLDATWLAERVGSGIEVLQHDVAREEPPAGGRFDLIHARLVLVHVPERDEALRRMVSALRPGGVLLVEDFDIDLQTMLCPDAHGPDQRLASRIKDAFRALFFSRGVDPTFGRRLPRILREHGLVDVVADGTSPSRYPPSAHGASEPRPGTRRPRRQRHHRHRDRPIPHPARRRHVGPGHSTTDLRVRRRP